MELTFAHYRNRFCMFRTYYALSMGKVKPDGFDMKVIELPDPPSHEQEEALIRGDVQVANIYLPNFLRRKLQGAPIIGLSTEWKSTMKGNGLFVRSDGPVQKPQDLAGRLIATHQGAHAIHRYLLRHVYGVDDSTLRWESHPQEKLLDVLRSAKVPTRCIQSQSMESAGCSCAVRLSASVGSMPSVLPKALTSSTRRAFSSSRTVLSRRTKLQEERLMASKPRMASLANCHR